MRTAAGRGGPDTCTYMDDVGYRKRLDGGYTIARGAGYRGARRPGFAALSAGVSADHSKGARLTCGCASMRNPSRSAPEPRRWPLDRPSPFERDRVLDPPPDRALNREAHAGDDPAISRSFATYPSCSSGPDISTSHRTSCLTSGPRGAMPGLTVATGILRPWFRHRSRPPAGSPQNSRSARRLGRPGAVSPVAFQRRLADRHRAGNLARPAAQSLRSVYEIEHEVIRFADGNVLARGPYRPARASAAGSIRHPPSPWCPGDWR